MTDAMGKYSTLFSTDCYASNDKAKLQKSWEAAYGTFVTCLSQSNATGVSDDTLKQSFRLPDCAEYSDAAMDYDKDWKYLQYLEEKQGCAGWCYPSDQQLWSKVTPETKDSC